MVRWFLPIAAADVFVVSIEAALVWFAAVVADGPVGEGRESLHPSTIADDRPSKTMKSRKRVNMMMMSSSAAAAAIDRPLTAV
jgi:hypothetical protein